MTKDTVLWCEYDAQAHTPVRELETIQPRLFQNLARGLLYERSFLDISLLCGRYTGRRRIVGWIGCRLAVSNRFVLRLRRRLACGG
jgi:hypothetical protein